MISSIHGTVGKLKFQSHLRMVLFRAAPGRQCEPTYCKTRIPEITWQLRKGPPWTSAVEKGAYAELVGRRVRNVYDLMRACLGTNNELLRRST